MDHGAPTISSPDPKRIGSRSKHNVWRLIEIKLCVLNVICSKVTLSVTPNHELFSLFTGVFTSPPPSLLAEITKLHTPSRCRVNDALHSSYARLYVQKPQETTGKWFTAYWHRLYKPDSSTLHKGLDVLLLLYIVHVSHGETYTPQTQQLLVS